MKLQVALIITLTLSINTSNLKSRKQVPSYSMVPSSQINNQVSQGPSSGFRGQFGNVNMETPIMVKGSGNPAVQGVDFRVANMLPQVRTNREAFDIAYGSREAWYNDKRYIVNDAKFDKMERFYVDKFQNEISNFLKKEDQTPIEHIEEYQEQKAQRPPSMPIQGAPQIFPEQLNNTKYYGYGTDRPRVTQSDPLTQMSPWKRSLTPQ